MTNPDLAALSEAATQGEWTVWREKIKGRADAIRELVEQVEHTNPLADALVLLNADGLCPGLTGCGPTSDANAAFIVALVNEYRAGRLVQIDEGMRERVILAMLQSEPHLECRADAAIAAMMGGAK